MRWLKSITAVALLAFWLPATNHCRLEQIPAFSFLVCCDHNDAAPHQDTDCDTDGCAVESSFYKLEDAQAVSVQSHWVPVVQQLSLESEHLRFENARHVPRATTPPELPKSWQFSFRAAAPPRAPSLAS